MTPRAVRRWPLLVAVLAIVLTGCSRPDTSPIENPLPKPDATAPTSRSVPPATGTWVGLRAKCPELTSAAASAAGVTGPGRPTPDYATNGADVTADCQWGSTDGQGITVTARMNIYRAQRAADAQWKVLSAGQPEPLTGVGDQAFVMLERAGIAVRVRSNNVVATVRLAVPSNAATAARLQELRPTAADIARDVLDDLH